MKGKSEPMNCWFLTRSSIADTLISDTVTDVWFNYYNYILSKTNSYKMNQINVNIVR